MKVTYLGTTMLLFDDGKDQLLFDCHVSRPSILKCLLGKLNTDINVADKVISDFEINRLKGIFISHTHHDHVLDAPYFSKKCNADIYGSASALNVARGSYVFDEKLHCFDEESEFDINNFNIKIIPSIHSRAHWYNDDIGMEIKEPVLLPARKKEFKEGGSYDFLVTNNGKRYLIRPSYNYIEGQFDSISADIVFLGIGGMSKDSEEGQKKFWQETVDKVKPQLVIPIHWDNFFTPLYGDLKNMPALIDNFEESIGVLKDLCEENDIKMIVQKPLTGMVFN